ncbi:MAG: hypothetical protein ACI841_003507 [Planctomycetota bacterium]|jgi:hypothetical protein
MRLTHRPAFRLAVFVLLMLGLQPLVLSWHPVDVCKYCQATRVCDKHAKLDEAEIERLSPGLSSEDARDRIEALDEIAALTEEHENAPSKAVAKVLAKALEDDFLRVRDRAAMLISDGQHPEIAVTAMLSVMSDIRASMWTLVETLMGPKHERGNVGDAMNYLETVMDSCGYLRDDRIVKALGETLMAYPTEMRGQPVAMAATRSLLALGTRDSLKTVLKQFKTFRFDNEYENIHHALTLLAADLDIEEFPEWSVEADEEWERWSNKYSRRISSKLGKWKGEKPAEKATDKE